MGNTTQLYECVACKRPLQFSNAATNLKYCSCGVVNSRTASGELIPKLYIPVPTADSIIKPGTTGEWEGKVFEVTGRMRLWFHENVFNYWTIIFPDNTIGYLGEGYGLYAIYKEVQPADPLTENAFTDLKVNEEVALNNEIPFYVQRIHKAWKLDIEGELWLPENDGRLELAELSAKNGKNIEIIQLKGDHRLYFDVAYTSFDALGLKNLRQYDNPGFTFDCHKCNSNIHLKAFPYVQSFACGSCGTGYFYDEGKFSKKQNASFKDGKPSIAIGTKGVLKGVEYEVLGFAEKADYNAYQAYWREYTLFNPQQGFVFLSEYQGNWTLVKESCDAPVITLESDDNFIFNDVRYQLYNRYSFKTTGGEGEYMGNAMNDGDINVKEFIHPPYMWIREKNKREGINWFRAEYIPKEDIATAFPYELPETVGMHALNPKGFVPLGKILSTGFFALLAFLVVFAGLTWTHKEERILDSDFFFTDSTNTISYVTEKFRLSKWRSNLKFKVSAPVSNDWFEMSVTLVNADKGTEYSLEQGVEYYSGYEGGEYWTEGSTDETVYMSSIPEGNYFLQIQGARSDNKLSHFNLAVTYDVPMWRNLLFILIALVLWPVIKYFIVNNNEKKRWANSDFSPYNYNDE